LGGGGGGVRPPPTEMSDASFANLLMQKRLADGGEDREDVR
jgi:hypothetical protein